MTKPGATDACREERQPAGAMAMSDQRSPSGRGGLGEHDMGSQPDTGREVRSERRYRARPPRDENWFEAIYRTHELAVRKYVVRRASAELADDVVSEVFTTLWRCRNDAPDGSCLGCMGWPPTTWHTWTEPKPADSGCIGSCLPSRVPVP